MVVTNGSRESFGAVMAVDSRYDVVAIVQHFTLGVLIFVRREIGEV